MFRASGAAQQMNLEHSRKAQIIRTAISKANVLLSLAYNPRQLSLVRRGRKQCLGARAAAQQTNLDLSRKAQIIQLVFTNQQHSPALYCLLNSLAQRGGGENRVFGVQRGSIADEFRLIQKKEDYTAISQATAFPNPIQTPQWLSLVGRGRKLSLGGSRADGYISSQKSTNQTAIYQLITPFSLPHTPHHLILLQNKRKLWLTSV